MDTHGQRAYLGVALLGVPLVALCSLGDVWRYAAVAAANLVALVVVEVARRRGGVRAGLGGSALVAGVALLAAHNVETLVAVAATGSPAGGAFAGASLGLGYALLLAGGLAATFPSLRRDVGGVLDAMVIGLVVAVVMWGVLLGPAHERLGSSVATRAYETFLVLLATALTGAVVRTAAIVGTRADAGPPSRARDVRSGPVRRRLHADPGPFDRSLGLVGECRGRRRPRRLRCGARPPLRRGGGRARGRRRVVSPDRASCSSVERSR